MRGIRAQFAGTGAAIPERVLTNADLEKMVDTSDEWIRTRTGIVERRIVAEDALYSLENARWSLSAQRDSNSDNSSGDIGVISGLDFCPSASRHRHAWRHDSAHD